MHDKESRALLAAIVEGFEGFLYVADQLLADAWSQALPQIAVQKELAVHAGGNIAWAVRKNNPKLRQSVDAFMRKNRKEKLPGNILSGRYFRNSRWIKDPHIDEALRPAPEMMDLFRKYGEKYDFNPLLLMAMAYRESGFDQSKRSPRGAVGVMQILPETAAGERVGVRDIGRLENNIHAGVKYLNYLRTEYFDDPHITKENRDFFALAAYNAGPSRLKKLRKQAAKSGFDPDKWFFNVERTAAAAVGREVVDYVADVYKYFIVYQLQFHMDENRKKAKQARLGG